MTTLYRKPNGLLANTRSIIEVITLLSMTVRHLGIMLEITALSGIILFKAIGPNPDANIPRPVAVPSSATETTSAHRYELVPKPLLITSLLLLLVSK